MTGNRFRDWYRSVMSRPLVLAHRGDSFRGPENTVEAAVLGFEAGADGWELDVQLTGDGIPVVLHDESLSRTTDVARRFEGDPRGARGFLVGDFTFEEVRTLDAGSWFVESPGGPRSASGFGTLGRLDAADLEHYGSGRVRVPSLEEALDWTVGVDWAVNVEIKATAGDPGSLIEAVIRRVRSSGATGRAAISSFDHQVVARVAALEPGLATGVLVPGPPDRPAASLLRFLGADALHAPVDGVDLSDPAAPVLVYTVNDARTLGQAWRLAEGGARGLFTDDPSSMAALFSITPYGGRTKSRWGTAGRLPGGPPGGPIPPPSR